MNFLEKDLEEIIYKADKAELSERGLNIKGKLFRQLRIGDYGIADLVSFERMPAVVAIHSEDYAQWKKGDRDMVREGRLIVTIYELKKDKIGVSAFLQAIGYLKGLDRYLSSRDIQITPKIVLIGKSLDTSSTFSYLTDYVYNVDCESFVESITYDYGMNGVSFNSHGGYHQVKEGF